MTCIRFTVPGAPRGKGRPRATIRGGRVATYTDAKTASYEALVALAARDAYRGPPLEGPVEVTVLVVLPRPARLRRRCDPTGLIPAPARPDVDNVVKAVLDGAAALWRDDGQVVDLHASKRYAEADGQPRVEVVVTGAGAAREVR